MPVGPHKTEGDLVLPLRRAGGGGDSGRTGSWTSRGTDSIVFHDETGKGGDPSGPARTETLFEERTDSDRIAALGQIRNPEKCAVPLGPRPDGDFRPFRTKELEDDLVTRGGVWVSLKPLRGTSA